MNCECSFEGGGRRGGLHRVESHTSLSEPVDYTLNFYFPLIRATSQRSIVDDTVQIAQTVTSAVLQDRLQDLCLAHTPDHRQGLGHVHVHCHCQDLDQGALSLRYF